MVSATTLTCLIMMLTHQGFWVGGRAQSVTVSWPVQDGMPAAKVAWELAYGETVLTRGTASLDAKTGAAELKMTVPTVRVAVPMKLHARALDAASGVLLSELTMAVKVYPPAIPPALAKLKGSQVLVWDDAAGLPALANAAGVDVTTITSADAPIGEKVDYVIVGPDRLDDSADVAPLLSLAQSGAGVLILRQQKCSSIGPLPLVERRSTGIAARWKHLVFEGLSQEEWTASLGAEPKLLAIRVPRTEALTALAWWRSELTEDAEPTDLLIASMPMGAGRLVLCQAPFTDWTNDPRASILLGNLLEYLQTPPEPPSPVSKHLKTAKESK
jgi:hypothetical protein